MVARIRTVAFEGVDVRPMDAQVQMSGGMPAFTTVRPIITPFIFLLVSTHWLGVLDVTE